MSGHIHHRHHHGTALGDTWNLANWLMQECIRTGVRTRIQLPLLIRRDAACALMAQCVALLDGPADCYEWCDVPDHQAVALTHEQVWGAPER